jgi:ATP-dependent helicase/nuclease subunit A
MTLPDQHVRTRIEGDLDTTLFVEAGAGSGKTTVLVKRIVALVCNGVPLSSIAAVTFTEKAAAELRDRVRQQLEAVRAVDALDELDGAAIGTLHSFARRVLTEHPIDAGLPPLIDVLDEVGSQVAADRRWDALQTALLRDESIAPVLRLGFAAGLRLDQLRTLAHALDENWDLAAERLAGPPCPGSTSIDLRALSARIDDLLGRRRECIDPSDRLLEPLGKLAEWHAGLREADTAELLALLTGAPGPGNGGKGDSWGGKTVVTAIKEEIKVIKADALGLRSRAVDGVLRTLLPRIADDTVAAAQQRAADGRLQFHDLLVLARNLVRASADVRDALSRRYTHLLLDESQDTDPIQVELAVRIAGGGAADAAHWHDVAVSEGALFFVGDAKQSIYRFRRADITTYLDSRDALGETVALTANFRATPEILDWINQVFTELIVEKPGAQPNYLTQHPATAGGTDSKVAVLGATAHDDKPTAEQVRARESHDIAALITRAISEGWQAGPRSLALADITILAPSRTSIAGLERALDTANIPYRTEAATFVYSAPEVMELLHCARAVDDPTDELAVVTTLRAAMFGCSDVDLWRWKSAGGSWNLFADPPSEGVVADGLAALRAWARSRLSPSELLEEIIERRRVLETAVDSPRYRETWRRLRFVVDQARAWSEAEHGSLREYLRWADRQAEDSARVTETVLPETDSDAVRITTIHASKGLEFPFVIVAGLGSSGSTQRPTVLWTESGCELNLGAELRTLGYADADVDEQVIRL